MLVAALDGFDTQAIGYTAPAIAARSICRCRNSARSARPVSSARRIGALSFGPLADLFGRKWFMIVADDRVRDLQLPDGAIDIARRIAAYRFFAGLGLGGVTPAFLAMGAELAPKRLRDVFVTVLFASFPAAASSAR